ncbi:sensor histidine kinase [Verrucomicrobium sp. BvORR034]|uniref:sensor histidine kinase n=1 Tax=Verrucomicrobium sp. BvORR034 TaxID=1396418 RepID=UPI000678A8E1|nr:sensor histidine kinase [Verrucomicrobium sp. BvORR034]
MNTKNSSLSRTYLASLREHLDHNGSNESGLKSARLFGIKATKTGMETLALAKIHESALETLLSGEVSPARKKSKTLRGTAFFTEAITPIEETHRSMRQANIRLEKLVNSLTRRTHQLAASNDKLKHEIVHRKSVEASLITSEMTSSQLLKKSRHMQEDLRHLSRRLLTVQEEERKRISRELHDVVAQALTSINLRLITLKTESNLNARNLRRRIAMTQRVIERSVEIVHRFARDLRPTLLDDLGLIPALKSYLTSYMQRTGIRVSFSVSPTIDTIDSTRRTVLYRVAQEALTNVARHAKASQANVSIRLHANTVSMQIHDNGRGFQVEGNAFARSSKCLGLLGMKERVEMVGGTFAVTSAPGKETTVQVELPGKKLPSRTRPSKLAVGKEPPGSTPRSP